MMKKIFLTLFLFALIFPSTVFSQTITIPMPTVSITPSPGPTPINYELPYPGILPGSPLYSLKMLRDKFSEILTSNPLEKSNFYLFQADKRLAAALQLYKNGNTELAGETLSKGINYLEKSFNKMTEAKKTQENVSDVFTKIKASSEKHKEEIERLQKNANGDEAEKLKTEYQKVVEIQNKVNTFDP